MKLERVCAVNFLSHRETDLEFTDLRMQIAGANGSGKTSLTVDAPLWALFGNARASTTEGLMGPWGRSMSVSVWFEIGGRKYRVIRTRGSSSSLVLQFADTGTDLSEKHIAMTQAKIEALVGSENAFTNTVVFKQGDALKFALARPSERKALFDELLGIEAFAEVERRANARIRGLKSDEERFVSELGRLTEAESKVVELRGEIDAARISMEAAEFLEAGYREVLDEAQRVLDGAASDLDRKLDIERTARATELEVLRLRNRSETNKTEGRRLEADLVSLMSGKCPTCGQATLPDGPTLARQVDLRERIGRIMVEQGTVADELVEAERDHVAQKALLATADKEIGARHEEAARTKTRAASELRAASLAAYEAKAAVAKLEGAIEVWEVDTSKTEAVRTQLSEMRRRITGFALIAEAFSKRGIPRELTRGFVVEVERAANALLVGLAEFTVRITLERDGKEKAGVVEGTVDVLVTDVAGERKVEMLSGGEKMRVMLAIRLAVAQVMAKRSEKGLRTLILDESLDGLDTAGKDAALTMLTSMTGSFDRMLFITHDPGVAGMFPTRVELAKLSDGSSAVVA